MLTVYDMPPIRPHCEEAAERDSNPGQVSPEAGTLTTRSPHLLTSEINPIESRFNQAKKVAKVSKTFVLKRNFAGIFRKQGYFEQEKNYLSRIIVPLHISLRSIKNSTFKEWILDKLLYHLLNYCRHCMEFGGWGGGGEGALENDSMYSM